MHEAAHAPNMHHGKGFLAEVERLGGVAAALMFEHAGEIRVLWPDLTKHRLVQTAAVLNGAHTAPAAAPKSVMQNQSPAEGLAAKPKRWSWFGARPAV